MRIVHMYRIGHISDYLRLLSQVTLIWILRNCKYINRLIYGLILRCELRNDLTLHSSAIYNKNMRKDPHYQSTY